MERGSPRKDREEDTPNRVWGSGVIDLDKGNVRDKEWGCGVKDLERGSVRGRGSPRGKYFMFKEIIGIIVKCDFVLVFKYTLI